MDAGRTIKVLMNTKMQISAGGISFFRNFFLYRRPIEATVVASKINTTVHISLMTPVELMLYLAIENQRIYDVKLKSKLKSPRTAEDPRLLE